MEPELCVAYVLKGYPRISELFIASEIWQLEQLDMPVKLFVLKPADESVRHRVVDEIAARPTYLPGTSSLSAEPLWRWLRHNLRPFLPALTRGARRHPVRLAAAAAMAARQAVRARKGWAPRKIYVKEFLQAAALADRIGAGSGVAHLHAHFAHGATTVTWLASRMTGIPFSFTGHAKDIYRESLNPAGLLVRKMQAAEFVVTCTGANEAHLRHVAGAASVHRVYHGLNAEFTQLVASCCPPRPTATGQPQIIGVGRLVTKKGFDVLVEAVAQVRAGGIDAQLVIAGEDGDDGPHIRALVAERGLDEVVEFVGIQTQEELLKRYQESAVFALACRVDDSGDRDGIPNVLMEAMAAGMPVVSTNISGIPELVIDGHNGLLVAPEDAGALADALRRVITDPSAATEMGRAARATIFDRFDGRISAITLAELFIDSVERHSGDGSWR